MQPRRFHIFWAEYKRHLPPISQAGLHLSEAVHQRGQQYRTAQQQTMSLLAKRLLHYGLRQLRWRLKGGLADLAYHPDGKPYLAHLPVPFSLSHSKEIAVCVISSGGPVGIDIQERVPIPAGSESVFLAPAERERTGSEDRLMLWCCKEAAYKAVGHELKAHWRNVYFTAPLQVECQSVTLQLLPQFIHAGYVCCLAVPISQSPPAAPVQITIEHVTSPY